MTNQVMTSQAHAGSSFSIQTPLHWILNTSNTLSALPLRLMLAVMFFPHGAQKVVGWFGGYGWSGTMGWFESIGVPAPVAATTMLLEFLGPPLLLLGLGTRAIALGMIGIMLGAIFTVHLEHGFFMDWFGAQQGEGFEFHLLVIGMAAALVISGGGRHSVDRILHGRLGS